MILTKAVYLFTVINEEGFFSHGSEEQSIYVMNYANLVVEITLQSALH